MPMRQRHRALHARDSEEESAQLAPAPNQQVARVLALQRGAGNRAVGQLLARQPGATLAPPRGGSALDEPTIDELEGEEEEAEQASETEARELVKEVGGARVSKDAAEWVTAKLPEVGALQPKPKSPLRRAWEWVKSKASSAKAGAAAAGEWIVDKVTPLVDAGVDAAVGVAADVATGASKAKKYIGEKASSAWQATKNKASSAWEATKNAAGKAWNATKGAAKSAWGSTKETASDAWEATKEGVSGAATAVGELATEVAGKGFKGQNEYVRGKKTSQARKGVGAKAWTLVSVTLKPAVEYGARLAGTFKDVVVAVPGIGLATNIIGAAVDIRALASTAGHILGLGDLLKDMKGKNVDPALQKAVEYAKSQKWKKAAKRSLGVAAAALGITAAALALVSNPVGWAVGLAAAGIGIGMFVYKLVRSQREGKGVIRHEMARVMMQCLQGFKGEEEQRFAERAVRGLGYDPKQITKDPTTGIQMIMKKLASS